jgi:hypothetical protein
MPPVLLDVLAVVSLRVRQAEQSLLEAVVAFVPHGHTEIEEAVAIAQPGDAVLPPAVGPDMGLLERERRPGVPIGRVVLPDCPPLAARDIRSP